VCVIHCVILAHNCFCNKLTNIVYIYRFRKNIEMETNNIKSGEICIVQKRWKDVICKRELFFLFIPKSYKLVFPLFLFILIILISLSFLVTNMCENVTFQFPTVDQTENMYSYYKVPFLLLLVCGVATAVSSMRDLQYVHSE